MKILAEMTGRIYGKGGRLLATVFGRDMREVMEAIDRVPNLRPGDDFAIRIEDKNASGCWMLVGDEAHALDCIPTKKCI